jgi:hypothetical protein
VPDRDHHFIAPQPARVSAANSLAGEAGLSTSAQFGATGRRHSPAVAESAGFLNTGRDFLGEGHREGSIRLPASWRRRPTSRGVSKAPRGMGGPWRGSARGDHPGGVERSGADCPPSGAAASGCGRPRRDRPHSPRLTRHRRRSPRAGSQCRLPGAGRRHCHVNRVWRPDWRPTRLTA